MRVGFLFNHDEFHQIAHTAPIIPALQRLAPEIEIDILASSVDQLSEAESYLDPDLPFQDGDGCNRASGRGW